MSLRSILVNVTPKRVAAVILTCIAAALVLYSWTRTIPQGWSLLITLVIILLVGIMSRLGGFRLPVGYTPPFIIHRPRSADVLRFVGCAAAGFVWVATLTPRVSDTNLGAALVFVPAIVLALAGTFLLFRGVVRGQK